jgi:hypothetical protein
LSAKQLVRDQQTLDGLRLVRPEHVLLAVEGAVRVVLKKVNFVEDIFFI